MWMWLCVGATQAVYAMPQHSTSENRRRAAVGRHKTQKIEHAPVLLEGKIDFGSQRRPAQEKINNFIYF
jgi:hypothetical protein